MRLIDKLVLKELIGPFINGMLMFTLLVFAVGTMFQATDWILRGISVVAVSKMVLLSLPEIITQTFPMAMLLAALLAFGRLSGDHEMDAIFAAGVSFLRAARAVLLAGVLVSVVAFFWNDYVVPPCKSAFWNIKQEVFSNMLKSDRALDYPIRNDADNTVDKYITINGGFDAPSNTLRRVTILQYSRDPLHRGQIEAELYCDRAVANDKESLTDWTYYDDYLKLYEPDKTTGSLDSVMINDFQVLQSSPQTPSPGESFVDVINSDITDSSRKNFHDLRLEILADRKKQRYSEARGKEVDLYGKIALPLAGIIFGLFGAALGCNTQRGSSRTVGFGLAIFIVFVYYVFYRSMFVVGKNGKLAPILASFLADIVGAVIALVLARRASR